jgi:hypothetical protein
MMRTSESKDTNLAGKRLHRSGQARGAGTFNREPLQQLGQSHRQIHSFSHLARTDGIGGRPTQLIELAQQQLEARCHKLISEGGVLPCSQKLEIGNYHFRLSAAASLPVLSAVFFGVCYQPGLPVGYRERDPCS